MSNPLPDTTGKRIPVFFYGSFIRREVMARGGLHPETIDVARLNGFDIAFCPHAFISPSDEHAIYGILVRATHQELDRLYSMSGVGLFLPEAVLVQTRSGGVQPAMCYLPPTRGNMPADADYVDHLLGAARAYGFPAWYLARLEMLRQHSPAV